MKNRRKFLLDVGKSALVASSVFLQPGCSSNNPATSRKQHPFIGTQLYAWGQYYERDGKNISQHLPEALGAIRDAGFEYAEGSVNLAQPDENGRFAGQLRERGLKPVSLYSGGKFHVVADAEKVLSQLLKAADLCSKEGFLIFNVNPDPVGREKTDRELEIQLRYLKLLGAELKKRDIALGIHHHTPEMLNGAREFHFNFRNSTPELLGFCYDVHWVFRGGLAPMTVLEEYSERIVSWHLRQSREQIWWETLDTGDINYQEIAAFARKKNLPGFYTLELALETGTKITRSVVENHRRSREYIRQVFKA